MTPEAMRICNDLNNLETYYACSWQTLLYYMISLVSVVVCLSVHTFSMEITSNH